MCTYDRFLIPTTTVTSSPPCLLVRYPLSPREDHGRGREITGTHGGLGREDVSGVVLTLPDVTVAGQDGTGLRTSKPNSSISIHIGILL